MKGILKGIGFFVLYFVLTMFFQTILSIVFMAFGAANGIRDENSLVNFANNCGIFIFFYLCSNYL